MAGEVAPKMSFQGLTAGASFIILAIAILIAWGSGDWWLLIPVLLLAFGIFGVVMGFVISATDRRRGFGVSDSAYILVWGCLLALLGVAWFINSAVPGSAPLILAMILLFVGGAVLAISLTRMRRAR